MNDERIERGVVTVEERVGEFDTSIYRARRRLEMRMSCIDVFQFVVPLYSTSSRTRHHCTHRHDAFRAIECSSLRENERIDVTPAVSSPA